MKLLHEFCEESREFLKRLCDYLYFIAGMFANSLTSRLVNKNRKHEMNFASVSNIPSLLENEIRWRSCSNFTGKASSPRTPHAATIDNELKGLETA